MKSGNNAFGGITIGLQLGLTVAAFVYAGYWLDTRYDKTPLFLSAGALLGMAIGFYHMFKELSMIKSVKPEEDKKTKIKWK